MKYLILNHKNSINLFYDDISRYLTSQTYQENEQLALFYDNMSMKDVCELAFLCFDNGLDYNIWLSIKKFVLENYKYNELAYRLLDLKKIYTSESSFRYVINQEGFDEFNKDADILFETSSNYRFNILNRYSKQISKDLLEAYKRQLIYFSQDDKVDEVYKKLEFYGLGRTVEEYVDKYLSLSTNHTHEFIESGSTASCYRIGDYTFKLIRTKWSYEPIICPDLYLILPNIEEVLIRNDEGIVLSGIEVQKYLKRSAQGVPLRIFKCFTNELERLGYYTSDTLINGTCGDNCRMLDKIEIPNTVNYIGAQAFAECRNLKEVNLPNNITTIYNMTFSYCTSLTEIEIPSSVRNIQSEAFYYCYNLQDVEFNEGLQYISTGAFYNCYNLTEITLPRTFRQLSSQAFYRCDSLRTIILNSTSVPSISGSSAFPSSVYDIYVLDELYDDYMNNSSWSYFWPYIRMMSELGA